MFLTEKDKENLSERVHEDIDKFCSDSMHGRMGHRVGASTIMDECPRKLWYGFRWVYHKKHEGRQQRLFNRGHLEEARFVSWLRGAGFIVSEYSDFASKTQHNVWGVDGHFGGAADGIVQFPASYGISENFLLEFKTQGTGAGFTDLVKKGLKKEKPKHYGQVCVYGRKLGLRYVLYLVINKNDDDIHVEVEELDWNLADSLEKKAERIIKSSVPPAKIAHSAASYKCKYCDFVEVCQNKLPPLRNCRSCVNASPVANGSWFCRKFEENIPKDFLLKGCDKWESILVED